MKGKRSRGLNSSAVVHTAAGRAAYERIGMTADRVEQLARRGDCRGALTAYGALERAYGEAAAHAHSGGRAPNPIGDTVRAESAFIRACLTGRTKLARGSEPPFAITEPAYSADPALKGRRRRSRKTRR